MRKRMSPILSAGSWHRTWVSQRAEMLKYRYFISQLKNLKFRELHVINYRHCLFVPVREHKTLKELAVELGVTPERIRQIEFKALRKIRYAILYRYESELFGMNLL